MRTLCLSVPVGFAINWKKNIWTGLMGLPSFNSFGPFSASRRAASGEESPETVEPSWANMSSADRLCQTLPFGYSTVEGVMVIKWGLLSNRVIVSRYHGIVALLHRVCSYAGAC